jgi:hypothetical protein
MDPTAMAGFDSTRVAALDPTAMAGFDSTRFAALDDAAMSGFKADQVGGMDAAAMTGFDSGKMAAMDPAAMAGFKPDQMAGLPPAAMAGLDSAKIANFAPAAMTGFKPAQMGGLPPDAIAGFSDALVTQLPPTAMTTIDSAQLGNFTPAAMGAFDADKMGALPPDAFAGFKPDQLEALPPAAFAGFEPESVGAMPLDVMEKFEPTQMAQLPKDAVGGLTPDQFDKLPPAALGGMTKDNLGGLDPKVMTAMTPEVLQNLPAEEIKNMPGGDFAKLMTNMDPAKITPDNVDDLLPTGWEIDPASGDLTAPPGAGLAFKTLDAAPNINGTTMPPLPDLSKNLALGGGGSGGSVLAGLDEAIGGEAAGFNFEQRSDGALNLNPAGAEPGSAPAAAFIPDASKMTQAPEGSEPGVSVDPDSGAFVLITDKGYSIPLLPALASPDAVKNLLPADAEIKVGAGGQTTISDLGIEGKTGPIVGIPSPLTEKSDKDAGTYASGSGADEKIEIVQPDGTLQVLTPAFQDQDEITESLNSFPGVEEVKIKTDGSLSLKLGGSDVVLKPHFKIETAPPGEDPYPPGIAQVGDKFYTTNKKGERQELSVAQ